MISNIISKKCNSKFISALIIVCKYILLNAFLYDTYDKD